MHGFVSCECLEIVLLCLGGKVVAPGRGPEVCGGVAHDDVFGAWNELEEPMPVFCGLIREVVVLCVEIIPRG